MITCNLRSCGLGSQLFQIATTLALSMDFNDDTSFNFNQPIQLSQGNSAASYIDSVYSNLSYDKFINTDLFVQYLEPSQSFKTIPYQPNLCLNGFFMSEKYFKHRRDEIVEVLNFDICNTIWHKYRKLFLSQTCGIHVRRGDYLKISYHHPIIGIDYYIDAIKRFDNTNFLVFSDDMEWCKANFDGDRFTFIDDECLPDNQALHLISMCTHQIIANSTFSWWGAWLNNNPEKIVIAPNKWFGSRCESIVTDDIYTEKMIKI